MFKFVTGAGLYKINFYVYTILGNNLAEVVI